MENYLTYAGDSTDIFEALGMTEEWEDEETIRIISARKATRHESKEYNKRITH